MASSTFSAVRLAQVVALDDLLVGKTTNEVEGELGLGTTESVPKNPAVAVRTEYSTTRPPRKKITLIWTCVPRSLRRRAVILYLVEIPTNEAPYHRLELCKALCSKGQTGWCADHGILETFYLKGNAPILGFDPVLEFLASDREAG